MIRNFSLLLFSMLIFITMPAVSATTVPISVGIACSSSTSKSNEIFFARQKSSSYANAQTCIEKHGFLTNLIVKKVNLHYSKKADSYILFLWIDNKGSEDLKNLTSRNLNRSFVILRNNKYFIEGIIAAPLDKGVIEIDGLDESAGRSFGNEIAGKHGSVEFTSDAHQ